MTGNNIDLKLSMVKKKKSVWDRDKKKCINSSFCPSLL